MNATQGTCRICGKRMSKSGMARHLATHLKDQPSGRSRLFRLRIEDRTGWYWIDVEIAASRRLGELDAFLRAFWLECCGHLSSFTVGGSEYSVSLPGEPLDFGFGTPARDMDEARLSAVLRKGQRFSYTYDFGTSTNLALRVVDERTGKAPDDVVRLLSRNEPPDFRCGVCGEPATQVCPYHWWDEPLRFVCDDHVDETDCEEDVLLPVVNSPRVGECAYTGPEPGSPWAATGD